jgi:hypothetical protein
MQKVRTRCVNIRVTDEEFERLREACERKGSRCLSAFARQMMLEGGSPEERHADLANFDRRLSALEDSISLLFSALAGQRTAPLNRPTL